MQPFQNADRVVVVLPRLDPTRPSVGTWRLFELERAGLEAELGALVEFAATDSGGGCRWLLEIPAFELRGLDWGAICASSRDEVRIC